MKAGLEIHQRLKGGKLFCSCTFNEDEKPIGKIKRYMHAVSGEQGKIDISAKLESEKKKTYIYNVYKESSCLVELDEEPPIEINKYALQTTIAFCLAVNAKIVDAVKVMRKTVLDGSNTSGFQRTAIIGLDGYLNMDFGRVKIETIALEEESAGIVKKDSSFAEYSLSRLGIPLIEITTDASLKTPEQVQMVAEKIGMLLRMTGRVMRGLGTIRQDVNVSCEGGARVEIKGMQDLKGMKSLIKNELLRQENLKQLIKKIPYEKINDPQIHNLSDIFKQTNSNMIKKALAQNKGVYGINLKSHKSLLGFELIPGKNRRYGSELSDYAKLAGVKGIIHSDEDLNKYGINEQEISQISQTLNIEPNDVFILILASENQAKSAFKHLLERAKMNFIPQETRKAVLFKEEYVSSFMRPISGKHRMYPETDLNLIPLTEEMIETCKQFIPKTYEQELSILEKQVGKQTAERLLHSHYLFLYKELVSRYNKPKLIANIFLNDLIAAKRKNKVEEEKLSKIIPKLLDLFVKQKITKKAIGKILEEITETELHDPSLTINRLNLEKIEKEQAKKLLSEYPNIKEFMKKYGLRVEMSELKR